MPWVGIIRLEEYLMSISDERLTQIEREHDSEIVRVLVSELRRVRRIIRERTGVQASTWPMRGAIIYPRWALDLLGVPRPERRQG